MTEWIRTSALTHNCTRSARRNDLTVENEVCRMANTTIVYTHTHDDYVRVDDDGQDVCAGVLICSFVARAWEARTQSGNCVSAARSTHECACDTERNVRNTVCLVLPAHDVRSHDRMVVCVVVVSARQPDIQVRFPATAATAPHEYRN